MARSTQPDRFLTGRTAWVTGGVTGMGRAIAAALARAGAQLAIGSLPTAAPLGAAYSTRPNADELGRAQSEIEAAGVKCFAQHFDLRSQESVADFHMAAVATLGPVDILINSAGVCAQEAMLESRDDTWNTVMDVNLNGVYRTTRRCLPAMIERGWGRIVNIGSTAASIGFARHSAYCASKHALLGISRCVALEGAAHGITCNVINPGTVATGMTRIGSTHRIREGGQGRTVEENWRMIAEGNPQKRLLEPDEIAALALFLCRDEARGLTAEAITVSGGAVW